jgi:hypothetical protein
VIGVGSLMIVLRRVRRHARDDVGADRQGRAADGRHDPAPLLVLAHFDFELGAFFDAIASRHLHENGAASRATS